MPEQPQSENEQISIEYQAEEVQVHEETGREQTQQEKQVSVMEESTPTEAANENSNEKPIIQEGQEVVREQGDSKHQQEDSSQQKAKAQELKQELYEVKEERPLAIEDIVKPGKFGVTNSQMIPAIKQVIADGSVEKLRMLRSIYLYSFENSLRYLKKSEREFIQHNLKQNKPEHG
ncbi:conserved domain protein [Paenibacillus sp. HGF5]|nr:conserved domain protein [Paenibacillus sp. HGF5]